MRHLSNIYDPKRPDARTYFTAYDYQEWLAGPEAVEKAWQRHLDWGNRNVTGPPLATAIATPEELAAEGYIGIYASDTAHETRPPHDIALAPAAEVQV